MDTCSSRVYTYTHSHKKLAKAISPYICQRQTGVIMYKYKQVKLAKHLMTSSQRELPNSTNRKKNYQPGRVNSENREKLLNWHLMYFELRR